MNSINQFPHIMRYLPYSLTLLGILLSLTTIIASHSHNIYERDCFLAEFRGRWRVRNSEPSNYLRHGKPECPTDTTRCFAKGYVFYLGLVSKNRVRYRSKRGMGIGWANARLSLTSSLKLPLLLRVGCFGHTSFRCPLLLRKRLT